MKRTITLIALVAALLIPSVATAQRMPAKPGMKLSQFKAPATVQLRGEEEPIMDTPEGVLHDNMYATSFAYGLGLRYSYASGIGWLLRFDLAQLAAIGAFNLSTNNHTGILSDNAQYIRCGMLGREDRINIDFAVTANARLSDVLDFEIDLGGGVNNTKVCENLMEIAGVTYSILDIWGGQSPDYGVGQYEYINQGGIGWNLFASALIGYQLNSIGAIRVGYTLYRSRTTLKDYTATGWNHLVGVRFELNNFSIFGK